MIKIILHQLWNERSMNSWIFAELLIVSFFLWTVIDPIYVLTANYHIDRGYEADRRYVVNIGHYEDDYPGFREDMASDSICKEVYWRITRIVSEQPEVESYSISSQYSFPNSSSWSGTQVFLDSASSKKEAGYVHAQRYDFVQYKNSNLFRTYGMKDARTGGEVVLPEDYSNRVFISETMARRLFGTIDVVGKHVYEGENLKIAGVLKDFKHRDFEQPYPLIVHTKRDMDGSLFMNWMYNFVLKLKDGVDPDTFEKRFRDEVAPQLAIGNFYFEKLNTFSMLSKRMAAQNGYTNKLRLEYALTGFAMLCIFLGMVGTFWIRCNARRQEIGLMRSMGASRNNICRQLLLEAALLVTLAFVVTVPLLLHHTHVNGMYTANSGHEPVVNPIYWQNCFGKHFFIVSLLSYFVLLSIALIATYIPAQRAVRVLPAEALRDE